MKQEVKRLRVHTVFHVGTGEEDGQQAADGRRGHEHAVVVEGAEGDGALSHVQQALRDAHHEEVIRLLVVVLRQRAQHPCYTRVVCAWVSIVIANSNNQNNYVNTK